MADNRPITHGWSMPLLRMMVGIQKLMMYWPITRQKYTAPNNQIFGLSSPSRTECPCLPWLSRSIAACMPCFSASLSQLASAIRSRSRQNTAMPRNTAGKPSITNSHCQPA